MKNTSFLLVLLLAVSYTLLPTLGNSQGWERIYQNSYDFERVNAAPASNGDIFILGIEEQASSDRLPYLHRLDVDGNIIWTFYDSIHIDPQVGIISVEGLADGGAIAIIGKAVTGVVPEVIIQKISASGEVLWMVESQSIGFVQNIVERSNGDIILFGNQWLDPADVEVFGALVAFDASGDFLWESMLAGEVLDHLYIGTGKEADNGDLMVVGTETDLSDEENLTMARFSASGNLLWRKSFVEDEFQNGSGLTKLANKEWLTTIYSYETGHSNLQMSVRKFDENGNELWRKIIPGFEPNRNYSEAVVTSYGFAVAGTSSNGNQRNDFRLARLSASGDLMDSKAFGYDLNEYLTRIFPANGSGFYLAGSTEYIEDHFKPYLVKTDSLGNSFTNELSGLLFFDENEDCQAPNEYGLSNWIISISSATQTFLTSTDDLGHYSIQLDSGSFQLEVIPPSPNWTFCNNPQTVNFNGHFLSNTIDFAAQAAADCPYLEVSTSTPFLRRCGFSNTYYVNYANHGTVMAEDAYVEFTLDPAMAYLGSSIPVASQNGQTYTFEVGDVDVNTFGDFSIHVEILCDSSIVGETHCVEAHIFPDSTCLPPPTNWSGASIEVDALCMGDSVIFFIKNVGTASTVGPINYIVIEEDVILLDAEKSLVANEDIRLAFAATGTTLRLEAEQELHHPKNDKPSVAVEGCVESNGNISLGYITQFAQNDDPAHTDIDCMVNTGAFDPNDKMGFPAGFSEDHRINQNQDIAYHIRFQNTGTDTAFNVVIRDTLSPFLDPTQLRIATASHPFEYRLTGSGVLEVRFPNIMLPDSNINEVASHGFVRFVIPQDRDLQFGTVINNRAAIYFDFNAPIITNQTWHTIGDISTPVRVENITAVETQIKVYPNPFVEATIIELKGKEELREGLLQVFNSQGQLVSREYFSGKQLTLKRRGLSAGIYFFQLTADGQALGNGKLLIE